MGISPPSLQLTPSHTRRSNPALASLAGIAGEMDQPLDINRSDILKNASSTREPSLVYSGYFLPVLSCWLVGTGLAALGLNGLLAVVLWRKQKKMASEFLVLANLVIDGLYGALVVATGVINMVSLLGVRMTEPHLKCVVMFVPHTFLILASMMLVLVIAVNRLIAVRNPALYKTIFTTRTVNGCLRLLLLFSVCNASVEAGLCYHDPLHESRFALVYEEAFIYGKMALLLAEGALMLGVYRMISNQFSEGFWTPVTAPFRALLPSKWEKRAAPQCVSGGARGGEEGDEAEEGGGGGGQTGVAQLSAAQVNQGVRQLGNQQRKHYVTTTLFFVSIAFLLVSLPNATVQLLALLVHVDGHVHTVVWMTTESIFTVNFILNPYLFSFNNSYLRERFPRIPCLRSRPPVDHLPEPGSSPPDQHAAVGDGTAPMVPRSSPRHKVNSHTERSDAEYHFNTHHHIECDSC